MTKTFCPHCYGVGRETFIETEYDEVVWEEFHTCLVCDGTGEVEVADKSGSSCGTSCGCT